MTLPRTVANILNQHVTLEAEGIDRMYLNVYQRQLQSERGVDSFFRFHRGDLCFVGPYGPDQQRLHHRRRAFAPPFPSFLAPCLSWHLLGELAEPPRLPVPSAKNNHFPNLTPRSLDPAEPRRPPAPARAALHVRPATVLALLGHLDGVMEPLPFEAGEQSLRLAAEGAGLVAVEEEDFGPSRCLAFGPLVLLHLAVRPGEAVRVDLDGQEARSSSASAGSRLRHPPPARAGT